MNNFLKISDQPSIGIASPKLIGNRLDADYYRITFVENEEVLQESNIPIEILGNMWIEANYGSLPESVDYSEDGIYLIRGTDISGYGIAPENELIRVPASYYQKFKKAQVFPGYLLILVKGASIDREDSNAIMPASFAGHAIINGSVFKVKLKPEFNNYYVAAFMFSRHFLLQKRRSVTNTGALYNDLETIRNYRIALPHPKIQAYISAKVRLAEKCREEAGNVYKEGQKLLDSSLDLPRIQEQKSFGWFIEPSKDIIFGRLNVQTYKPAYTIASRQLLERPDCQLLGNLIGNGGKDITGGATPLGASYTNSGIPFLRVQNVQKNYLDLTDVVSIDSSTHSTMKRSQVKPYDVIFTITGYPGSATCVSPDLLPLNMNQHSVRFSVRSDKVDPFFLAAFLNSDYGYVQVKQRATGATRDALDYPSIKSILVPVIDLTLQKRIGRFFRQYAFYRCQAERLIQEAKLDIESLIGGELNSESILAGLISSPTWDGIENQLNKHLLNYA